MAAMDAVGSPPRVRGTAQIYRRSGSQRGITPACAGNRADLAEYATKTKDHPRVCGEQPSAAVTFTMSVGSPPRVRGTGSAKGLKSNDGRITPACAGNSGIAARLVIRG